MKKKKTIYTRKTKIVVAVMLILISGLAFTAVNYTLAEQTGGSPPNGATSKIKTLYNEIVALTYGSDADNPDWGTFWNRIKTAAKWTPSGNATASDVRTGKTYNGNSRTQTTGTYPAPTNFITQAWHDSSGNASEANNYSLTWTTSGAPVTGDDNSAGRGGVDPRTGLTWSQYLKNNAGTVEFAAAGGSTWSWDATGANNIAVGTKTAKLLCSERGNGWRLPTQKELMLAYIDGSFWNLTNSSNAFWSATENDASYAWYVYLNYGGTHNSTKATSTYYVRCVR